MSGLILRFFFNSIEFDGFRIQSLVRTEEQEAGR